MTCLAKEPAIVTTAHRRMDNGSKWLGSMQFYYTTTTYIFALMTQYLGCKTRALFRLYLNSICIYSLANSAKSSLAQSIAW